MRQLAQKLSSGMMEVIEVPMPDRRPGTVLVRNYYSVISPGTEGSTVRAARKGYLGKALDRPRQVGQVLDSLRSRGPVQTYRAMMKKLDAWSPLGYSCVGEVIDVADDVGEFAAGDLVACGGATAGHAEVVAVPKNLCARVVLDPHAGGEGQLRAAAYNTLGAVALQGVRQAGLHLGEWCAVIGLGLLGQLTCGLLRASGVNAVGIDIDPEVVARARAHLGCPLFARMEPGIAEGIAGITAGIGCDAVIITAAADSIDPVNFAGAIARKRACVVVVGAVPTGFDRDPHYYRKELTLKMSCSYGPGRYDAEYEEKGRDYPAGYVRWTEGRNMRAFQDLVASGRIDLGPLTTHTFPLDAAPAAYDLVVSRSEPYLGILIAYERKRGHAPVRVAVPEPPGTSARRRASIGFIGAGSYAMSYLLPNLAKKKDVSLRGVMTSSPVTARSAADRFGFAFCTCSERDVLEDGAIDAVFVATRHDSHGSYVRKALEAGKHVFVEKPLCIREGELAELRACYASLAARPAGPPLLTVGFNRRFAPLAMLMKERMGKGPMAMVYRVNAGALPEDSWVLDAALGGGRIIGEVCHFVDFLTFACGSLPISVYAVAMADARGRRDTLSVSLRYGDGSVGSIDYFANGSASLHKEYIEVYAHGTTAIIDDFRRLTVHGGRRPVKKRLLGQDKGQKNEVEKFISALLAGGPPPIAPEEIFNATDVTFRIVESLRDGRPVEVVV